MMRVRTRLVFSLTMLGAVAGAVGMSAASSTKTPVLTPREKALHALNRLAFGPRPGDVDRVLASGIDSWIEQQLHPERISDSIADAKLHGLPTLSMSTGELFEKFERPLREARRERKAEAGKGPNPKDGAGGAGVELPKHARQISPEKRPRRIIEELAASRVLRASYSERQLNEVLVDFWMNHFNVFAAKGLDRVFVTSFERDTIRPHIWGRFEDLLMATAKSPAMLFYLDNAQSTAELANRPQTGALAPRQWLLGRDPETRPQAKAAVGLNENYARELMELHTLGVDCGYTQQDVTELARVLTGWSIDRRGHKPGAFLF